MSAVTFAERPECCPACLSTVQDDKDWLDAPSRLFNCGCRVVYFGMPGVWNYAKPCRTAMDTAVQLRADLAAARATLARVTALLDVSTVGHSAEWLRQQLRTALLDPATSAAIEADKRLELREEVAAG